MAGERSGRLNHNRKKCISNEEWMGPTDTDARITKMKDRCTHLSLKAERAVKLDPGAVVGVIFSGEGEAIERRWM
jgi:hypothetical protein